MTVEALLARMAADTQLRIAALQAGADAEVAAIALAQAQAAAHDQRRAMDKRRAASERQLAADLARAQRDASARLLQAQHRLVERVFARALTVAHAEDTLIASLPALVQQLSRHLGSQHATLRCRPETVPALREATRGFAQLTIEPDPSVPPGLVATTNDARCVIDATLPMLLSNGRPRLQAGLLARAVS